MSSIRVQIEIEIKIKHNKALQLIRKSGAPIVALLLESAELNR